MKDLPFKSAQYLNPLLDRVVIRACESGNDDIVRISAMLTSTSIRLFEMYLFNISIHTISIKSYIYQRYYAETYFIYIFDDLTDLGYLISLTF